MQAHVNTWRVAISSSIRCFGRPADSTRAWGGWLLKNIFRKVKNSLASLWNFS
jgi:hypothetical protein